MGFNQALVWSWYNYWRHALGRRWHRYRQHSGLMGRVDQSKKEQDESARPQLLARLVYILGMEAREES